MTLPARLTRLGYASGPMIPVSPLLCFCRAVPDTCVSDAVIGVIEGLSRALWRLDDTRASLRPSFAGSTCPGRGIFLGTVPAATQLP